MAKHSIREELTSVVVIVALVWCVSMAGFVFPWLRTYGITPRTLQGLVVIVASPFPHADWTHLLANTFPLVVLLLLLAGSRAEFWRVVVALIILGGSLLWVFGRHATHVGASGLIYGLIAFLIFSGVWERRITPMFVAVIVAFLYGGALLAGVVPRYGSTVSWDGHLLGGIAGSLVAYSLVKARRQFDAKPVGSLP